MKKFQVITEESISKFKSVGINADQVDDLVESSALKFNELADVLHKAHKMVADNQEQGHLLSIPKEQLRIVSDAIKYYRENAPIDDYTNFDTYSLEQLFSGDYKVDVKLTDSNWDFGQKSGVDIPEYVEDEPIGSCLNPTCRKELVYLRSEFCDDCEENY